MDEKTTLDGRTVEMLYCKGLCKKNTPHKEDFVPDMGSATVWHCLVCGQEKRPRGGNAPVPLVKPPPVLIGA